MTMTTLFNANNGKLTLEQLKSFVTSEKTLDDVKKEYAELKENAKALKVARRMQAFDSVHCVINWNNHKMTFNPRYVEDANTIYFGDVMSDCYVLARCGEDDRIVISLVAKVSEKSEKYEMKKTFVNKCQKTIVSVFSEVTSGVSFSEFLTKCKSAKTFKSVKCPLVLKSVLLPNVVKEEKELAKLCKSSKGVKTVSKAKKNSKKSA